MLWNIIGMTPLLPTPQPCHLLMTVAKVNDPTFESLPSSYYDSACHLPAEPLISTFTSVTVMAKT